LYYASIEQGFVSMKFDVHYFLSSKYFKQVIISAIVLFSALTLSEYYSLYVSLTTSVSPSQAEQTTSMTQKETFSALLSSSLFGVYVSNDLTGDDVKQSMLQLNLVGILLGNTTEESQVIISSAEGEEKNYKLNDELPGGAVIKRIMANGILVERNGALESLSFPKNDLTFDPVAKPLPLTEE
jgi:general secretion pathway protein C